MKEQVINFVIKKLDREIKTLENNIWSDRQIIEDMKNGIESKKEVIEYSMKEITLLKSAIQELEDSKK